jgi:anti-anti-sigma factor
MEVTLEHASDLLLVAVSGRLDTATASSFDEQLAVPLSQPQRRIMVDLAAVTYISSAGLRSILRLIKHTAAHGGRVGLLATPPYIMEVIEISGFPGLVDIYPDRASALAAQQS